MKTKTTMIPNNHVIANCHRWQQQAATNNAFATTFAIVEATITPYSIHHCPMP
jgi:hypothetical protein